jgi:predicted DNA-binding transcriptional regulator YafY
MIILNKLDAGARVTCHSLMNDLEISARSVYRSITTLQVAKFPIDYDRKKGTYSFTDGFSLKKPNISTEEALSLALAKRMVAPLVGKYLKAYRGSKKGLLLGKYLCLVT